MSARDPTRLSLGCRKVVCRYPGSPFVCLPGLRFALPSRSGRGCPQGALSLWEQLPFCFFRPTLRGVAREVPAPPALATHAGRGVRPPPAQAAALPSAPQTSGPHAPQPEADEVKAICPLVGAPTPPWRPVAPGGQDVGGGSRAPPREPRGRCQGEDAGSLCACSPGKQNQAPGAKDELTHHGGAD